MKPEDILALMNEPACAQNAKSKSGCAKPQPGATLGAPAVATRPAPAEAPRLLGGAQFEA